ncbi:MAG: FISUMP domain-containing protein [Patescibacteria group bacterium]|nr:MAG: FISUMP domain-containing protein [Patescibacteria group bacterium]
MKNIISFKKGQGFTLIELLVVIAIIGVLSTFAIVALGGSRASARDSKRLSDIRSIGSALELHYANHGNYPSTITPGQPLTGPDGTIYMSAVPSNPQPRTDGNCPGQEYSYTALGNGQYIVSVCMGSSGGSFTPGPVGYYTSAGMFNCGSQVGDEDGNLYNTVQIGPQCWMKENLKVGTTINSSSNQSNDSVTEKFCYDNNPANCDVYGGLYQWTEAMNLSYSACVVSDCSGQIEEQHQGICPSGWHIPTDQEFVTLERSLVQLANSDKPQYACNVFDFDDEIGQTHRCADSVNPDNSPAGATGGAKGAGKSIKAVGQGSGNGAGDDLGGFSLLLGGSYNGSSYSNTSRMWLANQASVIWGNTRYFVPNRSTITTNTAQKNFGFSVRCVKDS